MLPPPIFLAGPDRWPQQGETQAREQLQVDSLTALRLKIEYYSV